MKRNRSGNHFLVAMLVLFCWTLQGCDIASIMKTVGPLLSSLSSMLGGSTATTTGTAAVTSTAATAGTTSSPTITFPGTTAAPGGRQSILLLGQ